MKKHNGLSDIAVLESKLIKLEISHEWFDRIKIQFYHLNFCHCKSKSNLKQYFNNKSLILFVNHVLLGFYLCQSRIHKYYGFSCTHSA